MIGQMETTNEFARLLRFYDDIKRAKLNHSDLTKVLKKYAHNPSQMISDISLKYPEFVFPPSASSREITRICSIYSVPSSFPLPESNSDCLYQPSLDLRSPMFDPDLVLQSRNLFSSNLHSNLVDNLSKAKYLLPGADSEPLRKEHQPKPKESKVPNVHILDKIALASSTEKVVSEEGEISLRNSPLALLDKFMKERKRIRVLIRRRNGFVTTLPTQP
jgi:hypothetical protein